MNNLISARRRIQKFSDIAIINIIIHFIKPSVSNTCLTWSLRVSDPLSGLVSYYFESQHQLQVGEFITKLI